MPTLTTSPGRPVRSAVLSLEQARTVAIHASGHTRTVATVAEALRHLGIVQLDAINAVARAHELTLAARVAGATTGMVDEHLWGGQPVAFEAPAHALALVPIEDWPLWEFRREHTRARTDWETDPSVLNRLLKQVERDGPQTMTELRAGEKAGSGWAWGPVKLAVEYLVWTGELACVRRRGWNRVFDLPERVIPAGHRRPVAEPQALARLLEKAGRVLGVATADDLADYLRIHKKLATQALPDTMLEPVGVQGWKTPAWAHPEALSAMDTPVSSVRFVGPFDNLIWYRKRLTRLFGFDHTLEAYKPAAKRVYGYYAMPLLHGTRLVGRADCKTSGTELHLLQLSLDDGDQRDLDDVVDQALHGLLALTGTTRLTGR